MEPGFGDNKTNMLHDVAIFTGGQVYNEEVGMDIEKNFDHHILGIAKKVHPDCTLIPVFFVAVTIKITQCTY